MSMRDQYRTKAAEFQARALRESNQMTRHHFDTMAKDYLQLAELATQIDSLNSEQPKAIQTGSNSPVRLPLIRCPALPSGRSLELFHGFRIAPSRKGVQSEAAGWGPGTSTA
jgi:hypothetical protein